MAAFDSSQEKPSAMLASVPVLSLKSLGTVCIGTFLRMDTTLRPGEVTVLSHRDKHRKLSKIRRQEHVLHERIR